MISATTELEQAYAERYCIRTVKNMDYAYQNEYKKVRNLIKKISRVNHPLSWIPIEYMDLDSQVEVIRRLLIDTQREEVNGMIKVDADIIIGNKYREMFILDWQDAPDTASYKILCRNQIRTARNVKEAIGYIRAVKDVIDKVYNNEFNKAHQLKIQYRRIDQLSEYIEFVIDIICQFVIYQVLTPQVSNKDVIMSKLSLLTDSFNSMLDELLGYKYEQMEAYEILTPDWMFFFIEANLEQRSRLKEELQIFDSLKKEVKKCPDIISDVPDKYTVSKNSDIKSVIDEYMDIISEGVKYPSLPEKVELIRRYIEIERTAFGRNVSEDSLMDVKVYFRELFVSKAIYKRQQAQKIVKEYMKKVEEAKETGGEFPNFDSEGQRKFIREKITRGFYRETCMVQEYYDFNEFRIKFYNMLLRMYHFCNIEDGIHFLNNIVSVYLDLFERYV